MEKIFTEGLIVKRQDNAPEFVICNLSVKKDEFIAFLNKQEGEWVNLKVMKGKSGKLYSEVDTWKPKETSPYETWSYPGKSSGGDGAETKADAPW